MKLCKKGNVILRKGLGGKRMLLSSNHFMESIDYIKRIDINELYYTENNPIFQLNVARNQEVILFEVATQTKAIELYHSTSFVKLLS